jgi:hypothetical protein
VLLLGAVALLSGSLAARAANQAGEVVIARGIATAQSEGATGRILGAGSVVFEGDVVATGPRSVALLKLTDGTRMTLRPQTTFKVEEYRVGGADAGAVYRLFQGGLRAVTGYLSKRNPNAVRLQTAVATIGIRGTEFDARLCGADCAAEAAGRQTPAGRAGFVRGDVQARAGNGDRVRAVKAGGPVYSGDTLETASGGLAVLLFKDGSRVTLLPGTEFRVEQLVFEEAKPAEGRGFFALVRGGLRAVSGAIGKYGPRAYQMRTPVATIGIRGSGYDLALQNLQLFTRVNECCIAADDGPDLTPEQGVLMFAGPGQAPVSVPEFPIPVDIPAEANLPPPPAPAATDPAALQDSLIVACYAGNCDVQAAGETTELGAGEAVRVGTADGVAEELPEIPPFMPEDPALRTVEDNSSLNFLDETLEGGGSECFVQ